MVVVGASAGGIAALRELVDGLPSDFPLPVVAMLHLPPGAQTEIALRRLPLPVQRLTPGGSIPPGMLSLCPPNAYVDVFPDGTCVVSPIAGNELARPIDRLFSLAAHSFGSRAIGVILTGMNNDGSLGAREMHEAGGCLLVQSPDDAEYADMPIAAIAMGAVDLVVPLGSLAEVIAEFATGSPRMNAPSELRAIEAAFGDVTDVARAARQVDWQRTPLGPALMWPERLKVIVRETLDSAYPSAIWWGPHLTEVYNDAWRTLLGPKHPNALGKPARQTWENEWGRIGPPRGKGVS